MKTKNLIPWIITAAFAVVVVLALSQLKFGDSLVYFYTPQEALAKAASLSEQSIKLGGLVKPSTVEWKPSDLLLTFILTDNKGVDIRVEHKGSPPDLFKEGQGVVAEGKISADAKSFKSKRLMVKHSEEYKKPEDHSKMNQALLEDSLFKDQK